MKRLLIAISVAVAASAAAGEKHVARSIDLDRPGALEALEGDNPAHFAKLQKFLREAPHRPLESMQGWIRAQFDADDVVAPFPIRTVYPPELRMSFVLDDTRYTAVIALRDVDPKLMPAR
jgi:hypothetical protein